MSHCLSKKCLRAALFCLLAVLFTCPARATTYFKDWTETGLAMYGGRLYSPDAIRMPDDSTTLFFEYSTTDRHTIYRMNATDGVTFGSPTALLSGQAPGIMKYSGGYRLYWLDSSSGTDQFKSAFSSNGTSFTEDSGVRLAAIAGSSETHIRDPEPVALPGGGFRLYYTAEAVDGSTNIHTATSTDGLTWTRESGGVLSKSGASTANYSAPDVHYDSTNGVYRMFFNGPNLWSDTKEPAVLMAYAADGVNFSIAYGPELAEDTSGDEIYTPVAPSVVNLGDGTLHLFFQSALAAGGTGASSGLMQAQKTLAMTLSGYARDESNAGYPGLIVGLITLQGGDSVPGLTPNGLTTPMATTADFDHYAVTDGSGYYELTNIFPRNYDGNVSTELIGSHTVTPETFPVSYDGFTPLTQNFVVSGTAPDPAPTPPPTEDPTPSASSVELPFLRLLLLN